MQQSVLPKDLPGGGLRVQHRTGGAEGRRGGEAGGGEVHVDEQRVRGIGVKVNLGLQG